MNTNNQIRSLVPATRGPIRFENVFPGSFFKIVAEPSRGIRTSSDDRLYRKARDHEGFFATVTETGEAAVLMPYDIVQPLKTGK